MESAEPSESDVQLLLVTGGAPADGALEDALEDAGYDLVAVGSSGAPVQGDVRRKLEACRERYRVLFEEGVAGAFQATRDGEVVHANRALVEILGADAVGDVVGRSVGTIFDRGDWARVLEGLGEEGAVVSEEVRAKPPGGGESWLLLSCSTTWVPGRREAVIIGTVVDITARKRMESDLEWMAYHDALTGLVNRRGLVEQGGRHLALAARRGDRAAVAYLDLAGFKAVNDEHGHEAGDFVLSEVARRLTAEARASDVVARVGGDEFVVLMTAVDGPQGAAAAARRFSRAVDGPVEVEGDAIPVRGEFGVAVFPEHGDSLQDLLAAADTAMYQLKTNGGEVALCGGRRERGPGSRRTGAQSVYAR